MHTHVSGLTALYVFLMVALVATFWRIGAGYLVRRGGLAGSFGEAMAFQI